MMHSRKRGRVMSEINITPFTDVVLVLLIIFMITVPPMIQSQHQKGSGKEKGFDVQLPLANKAGGLKTMTTQVVIVILKDGRMVLGGEVMPEETLKEKLLQIKTQNPEALVIIQADRVVEHWRVVHAMDIAATVGLNNIAIATQED